MSGATLRPVVPVVPVVGMRGPPIGNAGFYFELGTQSEFSGP